MVPREHRHVLLHGAHPSHEVLGLAPQLVRQRQQQLQLVLVQAMYRWIDVKEESGSGQVKSVRPHLHRHQQHHLSFMASMKVCQQTRLHRGEPHLATVGLQNTLVT